MMVWKMCPLSNVVIILGIYIKSICEISGLYVIILNTLFSWKSEITALPNDLGHSPNRSPTSQEGGRTTTLSGTQERLAVAEFADKMQQVRVTSTSHD